MSGKRMRRKSFFLLILCIVAVSFLKYGNHGGSVDVGQSNIKTELRYLPSTEILQTNHSPNDILLVNADNPLPEDYRPENLVNLYKQSNKHFLLMRSDIKLSKHVFEAMNAMFAAAQQDGVSGFYITSGYRTREEQRELYNTTTDGTAAKPGESEHETGLAFDVGTKGNEHFELTPQFKWLSKHCAEYGFILRYPKGMEEVTGFPYEPWHYRYVGIEAAEAIMDKGITLEQYFGLIH
ncbi:MAG TPA: M15 family metallopeptidase [Bacilli bacterium]